MKPFLASSLILIALLGVSCSTVESSKPLISHTGPRSRWLSDWLTAPACQPPCWENITPGKTLPERALSSLNQVPGLKILSHDQQGVGWLINGTDAGGFEASNGIVSSIHLGINVGDDLYLGEVNAKYGTPMQVRLASCNEGQCEVHLIYPEYGMIIVSMQTNIPARSNTIALSDYSVVTEIVLVSDIQNYEQNFALYAISPVLRWKGYGEYP